MSANGGIAMASRPGLEQSLNEAPEVLARVAQLNLSLTTLQERLRALGGQSRDARVLATPITARAVWLDTHAEAVSLREDLMRVYRAVPDVFTAFRSALPTERRDQREERAKRAATSEKAARELLESPLVPRVPLA